MINNYQDILSRLRVLGMFMIFISMGLSKGIGNVSIVSFFIISLTAFNPNEFKRNLIEYKHIFLLILVFIIFLVGMTYTENTALGWKVVRRYHRFLIIPILFLMNVDLIKKYFKEVIFAFVLALSSIGFFTIILYFLPENAVIFISELTPFTQKYIQHYDRVSFGFYSPFYDRLQFSNMLGLATIGAIYLYFKGYKRKYLLPLSILLIYSSTILGGRAGQLALLFSVFVIAVYKIYEWYKRTGKTITLVKIITPLFIVFIVGPIMLYNFNHSVHKRYGQMKWELETFFQHDKNEYDVTHFTTVRRIVSWQNTWKIAKNNFFFGVGTGDYDKELQTVYDQDGYELPTNSHSQYLYFWATLGLVGLLIFLFIIYYWFKQMDTQTNEFLMVLGFLSFYGIVFMFDIPISQHIDNMTFTIIFCALGIVNKKDIANS